MTLEFAGFVQKCTWYARYKERSHGVGRCRDTSEEKLLIAVLDITEGEGKDRRPKHDQCSREQSEALVY